jgi:filamentous hemagglutinin
VTTTSGLFAGSGGFEVNVGGTTSLAGAALASAADASKNSLTTGALITRDLVNFSNWTAKTTGVSLSYATGGLPKPGTLPTERASGSSSGMAFSTIAPGKIMTGPQRQVHFEC